MHYENHPFSEITSVLKEFVDPLG